MKKRNGFTLIELLIVIAIILILIAIALPNFLEAQIRARVTKAKGNARTIGIAMEAYLIDFGNYPNDHDPDDFSQKGLYQLTSPLQYLTSIPEEPFAPGGNGLAGPTDEVSWEMGSTGLRVALMPVTGWRTDRNMKINAFGLASFGPDINDDFPCGDPWPLCVRNNPCAAGGNGAGWTDYAPTNGTKSNGDIMQIGGEWRTGSYCVNGWDWVHGHWPAHIPG